MTDGAERPGRAGEDVEGPVLPVPGRQQPHQPRRGTTEAIGAARRRWPSAQKEDGHLDAEQTSITGSGGRDLQIETTALAVLGWLKANARPSSTPTVQKAVKWIGQQRGGYGGFGSTQSTILALKALIAYTKANKRTAEAGELTPVRRRQAGRRSWRSRPARGGADAGRCRTPRRCCKPGTQQRARRDHRQEHVPVHADLVVPDAASRSARTSCPVQLATTLDRRRKLHEGDTVRLTVTVENVSGKGQGMAVAIVGLPGGLTLPEDMKQLKEYARAAARTARGR